MKKIVQLNLLLVAILLAFTACNEDPIDMDIDNPGVEKRLKTYVSQDDEYYFLNNYEYENDKVSKIEAIGIEDGSQDTSYRISEFSYVGSTCEVITMSKSIYTSNNWEIQGKTEFEFDANRNVISEKNFEYLNGAYETSPYRHVEFSYLSSGQLKSYTFIAGLGNDLICEFSENNLLTKITIGTNGDSDYSNDGVNVTGYSFDDYSVSYSYDSENKLMLEESFENGVLYKSTNLTYNSDGLLTAVNNFDVDNDETYTNNYVYESGKGNMQSFWNLLTDNGGSFVDVDSHKAMNKGIATIK